ncbi:H-NS histone family protein [Shewanella sp. KX20019]|uniref:H-NS histone family protein n=1 Tax=Shewanella sp. KX20019 TaxID=2803864 RepID=UPI00192751F2|nr:H-NS histone family protein [Shewanella sp. KX20019]QQX80806.1 H-NS histone family protein [Shewanella sp. KX20019]
MDTILKDKVDSHTKRKEAVRYFLDEISGNELKLKAFFNEMSISNLKKFSKVSTAILEVKELDEEAAERIKQEKLLKLEQVKRTAKELGLSDSDLFDIFSNQQIAGMKRARDMGTTTVKRPYNKRPLKYKCEVDGKEHFWSGQGPLPKLFITACENDKKTKEDYLLPEIEWR